MKPTHLITLGLIAGGMMCAGCTGQPDQLAQPDQTPAPQATDTSRQTRQTTMPAGLTAPIEFGPFDANAPDFQLFKPCEEIPAEVYRELGMGEIQGQASSIGGDHGCLYSEEPGHPNFHVFGITVNTLQDRDAPKGGIVIEPATSAFGVDIDILTYPDSPPSECVTSVMTSRGRWTLDFESEGEQDKQGACRILIEKHSALIKYLKGE
ncbi:DUF3558 family protein [Corynebacterium uberis]|uniref:DUF3558 family protein n=1 Tax=Corynebacterium TaxID=1716 RepID=UPI001D0AB9AF|nr:MULTISPECIES: DUF3558 family protein [Corynebacterium]MCZ9310096.1 DUF3558 domain-containing protein [Corynebacterium sp. c6VSa_13]UDL73841.1 DUF3558 domain-containing protein [Corynebacterium uberis]UDL75274.1 DUF3558 domain-containing protein [Corynebacterium uberis]UDL77485.1 DUF3558 domain-containing protein [Corynebacterium uberis]UDL79772.1 DUF3558 domain-containing protein [Corynebacterium uberis]